jgi:hypothetical protein
VEFDTFCKKNNIYDLNEIENNEELKIYIINKAENIIITWGSLYYININYYLLGSSGKFISLITHNNFGNNIPFFYIDNNIIIQQMPHGFTGGITDQYYNLFTSSGEILYNISNINDYISQTKLFL